MTTQSVSPPVAGEIPPLAFRLALFLVSAAALSYEILLTRLFAIIQWHHFAYMMISVALLGYGVAGTVVALFRNYLESRFLAVFSAAACAFGVTAVACFLLAQAVPFNALEFLWDWRQPLWMLAIYLLLLVPFFFAAICVCLAFTRYARCAHLVYTFDILGAAAGSLGVILALFAMRPGTVLGCLAAGALAAAGLAMRLNGTRAALAWTLPAVLTFGTIAVMQSALGDLRPSQYKQLSQTLEVTGAHVVAERSSPLGLVTVVDSPEIPFRHAPGLSLNAPHPPPCQLAVFTDGEGMSALLRDDGRRKPLSYLDYLTSALPYHLRQHPRVLVLGAGAGADVLQAIYHEAAHIDVVELNPQTIELVEREFADFSGRPYSRTNVRLHIREARGFIATSRDHYDIIQLGPLDAFDASSAGLYALSENCVYTVEAIQRALDRLAPGGLLSMTRWVDLPPRDALKLFATVVTALERRGVQEPGSRLAMIRGWKTATLLIGNRAFTADEIALLREFCRARSFDLVWYPGMASGEANLYNRLEQPYFHQGAVALLGAERDRFTSLYKFDIAAATDDRPFFFQFFRWKTLPEVLHLRDRGGLPLLDWGYLLVVATLGQALLASMVLVLLPLKWLRNGGHTQGTARLRTAIYFGALGTAFMFVEIAFIQRFMLFLSHPLYAIAVVLFAFLFSAGLGSALSARLAGRTFGIWPPVVLPVLGIALLAVTYLFGLPAVFEALIGLPDAGRIAFAVLLILPLGMCMGMPFPLGLEALGRQAPALVPWGWGINACASVISAVLATLLAIHLGFTAVILLAAMLYGLCIASFPVAR
ncbi:MAG TPA: SAM-dependent methyltransferase [Burkholderiales bacterium]|nr:SAM-dependent methyltransferase [Burkholderiales bacterium]